MRKDEESCIIEKRWMVGRKFKKGLMRVEKDG